MHFRVTAISLAIVIVLSGCVAAQTTAFNFQGRLNDGTAPANGRYDLRFKLFDAMSGSSQIGEMADRPGTMLINGVFSTPLDFGSAAFDGGDRFVEISVRPAGSPNAHVVLGGRQQVLAVPFSVRAATAATAAFAISAQTAVVATTAATAQNADALGGVAANNYARLNFDNTGNFQTFGSGGFGTSTPNARLSLVGGPPWTSNAWAASMNMQNGSALGWGANSSGQRFGIGQTNGGLQFFRTISAFGSTLTPAQTDILITDNGDITQPLERNGLVKGMAAITANGTIARCYNGATGSSSGNCGFSIVHNQAGVFYVNFHFQTSNRFISVTADGLAGGLIVANAEPWDTSEVKVVLHREGSLLDTAFHVIVF